MKRIRIKIQLLCSISFVDKSNFFKDMALKKEVMVFKI